MYKGVMLFILLGNTKVAVKMYKNDSITWCWDRNTVNLENFDAVGWATGMASGLLMLSKG